MPRSANLPACSPILAAKRGLDRIAPPPQRSGLPNRWLRSRLGLPPILLALLATAPTEVSARELIANGDFAATAERRFDHWTARQDGVRVQQASVIAGEASAEILRPHPNNLYQTPAEPVSSFVFRMEFAVFDVAGGDRTMNVLLYFRFGPQGPHLPLVHKFTDLAAIRGRIGYYQFGNARPPHSLCNLSRPDMSLLLRAPLAKEAGGLAWCDKDVFADPQDPDYQLLRAAIVAASEHLAEIKRFDMPGFRPNVYFTRQMQRYGILPPEQDPLAPFNFRAVERDYWNAFHHEKSCQNPREPNNSSDDPSKETLTP